MPWSAISQINKRVIVLERKLGQLEAEFPPLQTAVKKAEASLAFLAEDGISVGGGSPPFPIVDPRGPGAPHNMGVKDYSCIPFANIPAPALNAARKDPIFEYRRRKKVASRVIHSSAVLPRSGNFLHVTIARPPSTAVALLKRRLPGLNSGGACFLVT